MMSANQHRRNSERRPAALRGSVLMLHLALLGASAGASDFKPFSDVSSGHRESISVELAQIEFRIAGDSVGAQPLEARDLSVKVGGVDLRSFKLDRICRDPSYRVVAARDPAPSRNGAVLSPATDYLLYIDQSGMELQERELAIETARTMAKGLVSHGDRVGIAGFADRFRVAADYTWDLDRIEDALDEVRRDLREWAEPAWAEPRTDVAGGGAQWLRSWEGGTTRPDAPDRLDQHGESARGERRLRGLTLAIRSFGRTLSPRILVWFTAAYSVPAQGYASYEAVQHAVGEVGVLLYVVPAGGGGSRSARSLSVRDLSRDTGGTALVGASPTQLAASLDAHTSCFYLLSFDPRPLPRDELLPVKIDVARKGARPIAPTWTLVASDASRAAAAIAREFQVPSESVSALEVHLILGELRGRRVEGLLQVVLRTSTSTQRWDLGANVVHNDRVRTVLSRRIERTSGSGPIVFEQSVSLPAGPLEVVAVAYNIDTGQTVSRRLESALLKPTSSGLSLGPTVLLQQVRGAVIREERIDTEALVALPLSGIAPSHAPVTAVTLVCSGHAVRGPLRVQRRLTGKRQFEFSDLHLPNDGHCSQVRDVIVPDVRVPGLWLYEISAIDGANHRAKAVRSLAFVRSAEAPGAKP